MRPVGEARAEALGAVRRILIENLKLDRSPETIDPDVPLFGTGLGLDSVDAVELVVALETVLGVVLPEEMHAAVHLRTVNTVVDLVLALRGVGPTGALEAPAAPADDPEHRALREATALSVHPELVVVRLEGPDPFGALDALVPTDLYLRDGQMRQSLLLDDEARPIADLYVAHDDGALVVIAEGLAPASLEAALEGVAHRTLTDAHDVVSLHGPWAWELVARVLGEDLLSLPYLSFFHLEGGGTCFRGGKTGEYGYDLLLPKEHSPALVARLRELGAAWDLVDVSQATLTQARRESFFFDPACWRGEDVTPHELQLLWRCSERKGPIFRGAAALAARRPRERLTCLVAEVPLEGEVRLDGRAVGRVAHAGRSPSLGLHVGHALLDRAVATPGIEGLFVDGPAGPVPARAVSPPVLRNQSLLVDPRRDRYAERAR
ncbi:MAG: hypothetical protein KF729_12625 [Sandaracinaceae bacterium]|nr:hypothetical protein [Sandaracinaceae bacterium]